MEEVDCINLLKAMEIEESICDPDESLEQMLTEEETLTLTEEWLYNCSELMEEVQDGQNSNNLMIPS